MAVAGLVICRQRPGTAKGVIFLTLEDETGIANVVVWAKVFERFRRAVIAGRCLKVTGRLQRDGDVVHVVAEAIEDISALLDEIVGIAACRSRATRPRPAAPGVRSPRRSRPCQRPSARQPMSRAEEAARPVDRRDAPHRRGRAASRRLGPRAVTLSTRPPFETSRPSRRPGAGVEDLHPRVVGLGQARSARRGRSAPG